MSLLNFNVPSIWIVTESRPLTYAPPIIKNVVFGISNLSPGARDAIVWFSSAVFLKASVVDAFVPAIPPASKKFTTFADTHDTNKKATLVLMFVGWLSPEYKYNTNSLVTVCWQHALKVS